jgi:hypothetical protein
MGWFTDEAIEQNIKTGDVYSDAAPISGRVMRIGIEWLKKADRYRIEIPLIPHGGEERNLASMDRYAHGLIMPSKFCVIEYEHGGLYDMKPDLTRALSTRRIALCVDLESEDGVVVDGIEGFRRRETDHGGVLVWSINYFDEKREWEFSPGAAIIPRYQVREYLADPDKGILDVASRMLGKILKRESVSDHMEVTYQEMLPEICAKLGDDHKMKAIQETNMDAIWTALGFFSSFGCENITFDSDKRANYFSDTAILANDSAPKPLDPFHGSRKKGVTGSFSWMQDSRFVVPE